MLQYRPWWEPTSERGRLAWRFYSASTHAPRFIITALSMSEKMEVTFCWLGRLAEVRCHGIKTLGRDPKFRLRNAQKKLPWSRSHEFRNLQSLPLTLWVWRGTIIDNFRRPMTSTLTVGEKLSTFIIHRPLPTFQVSSRSNEKIADGRTDGHQVRFYKVISPQIWPENPAPGDCADWWKV